eukprot:311155-Chlamydomonas_euryale.AAC.2
MHASAKHVQAAACRGRMYAPLSRNAPHAILQLSAEISGLRSQLAAVESSRAAQARDAEKARAQVRERCISCGHGSGVCGVGTLVVGEGSVVVG